MKAVWVALALLLTPAAALAQAPPIPICTFTPGKATQLFRGVEYQTVDVSCPTSGNNPPDRSKAHVVRFDLSTHAFSFETSTWAADQSTFVFDLPTAFLERTHSQIGINANLFTNCCSDNSPDTGPTSLCGLEISHGKVLSPAGNQGAACLAGHLSDTSLTVTGKTLSIVPSASVSGADFAITGSDTLVLNNKNVAPTKTGDWYGNNARSAIGLSANKDVLWLAAVDQVDGSAGVTLPQAADLMIFLGAAAALNLDGSGSTALALQTPPDSKANLLNIPKDKPSGGTAQCGFAVGGNCERYVGAVFAVQVALPDLH